VSVPGCNVAEVWEYVRGLELFGTRLGLERITQLVAALGDPQRAYKTIHVVGTNGKTSTARFISALLLQRGLKVGTYISPHLVTLAERQMVDLRPAGEEEFCDLVSRIRPVAAKLEAASPEHGAFTQFEVLTAAALLYFKERGCDVAVVEAGLGGRLDATAVISSDVQVITTIGLEHTQVLGDTLSAILREKAAVIPEGGQAVAGLLAPEVKAELREICREKNAEVRFLDDDLVILADPRADSFDVFGVYDCYSDLSLAVLGSYQRANAAVAIAAAELFLGEGLDQEQVREALLQTRVPGRLEIMSKQPLCTLDGSHNLPGMEETLRSLDQILERRRLIAVVSILRDKDAAQMLQVLAPRCDIIFATENDSPRSHTADAIATMITSLEDPPQVFVDPDPRSAMMSAYRLATSNQVVLVTGSLALISHMKRTLG
jgi:dihydrofolate synthase/folylpolyglutamate synthase